MEKFSFLSWHHTDKVSIFIMTSTNLPIERKSLFHDQEMALPQSALDWTPQIVWTLFDQQALWKFWGIVDHCQLLAKKMSKLANDWQKLSNTVKYWQELSNTVKYTVKCCQKLWNIVKWKKWWLIVNHTLWFQWWQSQPCWSGSWWRIPSNRWK